MDSASRVAACDVTSATAPGKLRALLCAPSPAYAKSHFPARAGPTVVLHGHFHVRDAATSGPVLHLGFAALVEPPNEVAVLDIEAGNEGMAVRVRCLPIEPMPAARLPVLVPERHAWRFVDGAWRETAAD